MALASVLLVPSCTTIPSISASDFNDAIVDEHTKVIDKIQKYYNDETYEYEVARQICQSINNQCDTAIRKVNDIAVFEGGEDFRNKAIKMFHFYKRVSQHEFLEMSKILAKEDYDEEDMKEVTAIEEKLDRQIEALDLELELAQKKFAKKFKFTIEY